MFHPRASSCIAMHDLVNLFIANDWIVGGMHCIGYSSIAVYLVVLMIIDAWIAICIVVCFDAGLVVCVVASATLYIVHCICVLSLGSI